MSNGQNRQQVTALFEKLCQAVEAAGWQIKEKNLKEKFPYVQYSTVCGNGVFPTFAAIHPEMMVLMVAIDLQEHFFGEHPRELAVAMQLVNKNLPLGDFDTFIDREYVCYRLSCACRDAELSVEQLTGLLTNGAAIAGAYEPLFLGVCNGDMTVRQFAAEIETKKATLQPGCEAEKAKRIFAAVCKWMDEEGIAYDSLGKDLSCVLRIPRERGGRLFDFCVDAEAAVLQLRLMLPIEISVLRRVDMVMAINYINSQVKEGHFVYDVATDDLDYRMTALYSDEASAVNSFRFMLEQAAANQNAYLPALRQLNDGEIALWQFRNQI